MSDHVAKLRWHIRRRDVETFLPFDLVEAKLRALPPNLDFSVEDQRAVEQFKKTAERPRIGQSDDDPFTSD